MVLAAQSPLLWLFLAFVLLLVEVSIFEDEVYATKLASQQLGVCTHEIVHEHLLDLPSSWGNEEQLLKLLFNSLGLVFIDEVDIVHESWVCT